MQRALNRNKEVVQDISIFSASMYLAQIMYFLRGFLNARIVGPSMYGVWAALNIILSFGFFVHLGVLQGMSREIPFSLGKGDYEDADTFRNDAFGFCLTTSLLVGACLIMISLFFRQRLNITGILGIVTIAILIVMQNTVNFYETAFTALKRFSVIALGNCISSLMFVILTLILVTRWKIYGIYIVAVTGTFLALIFYYANAHFKIYLRFSLKNVLRLIKIGLPLMSLILFPIILFEIDRILILKFLGATELGYYALGLLICKFLYYLPAVIGKVMEPRLFRRFGECGEVRDLKKYLFVPTRVMSVFLPLLIAVVYFTSSFIIKYFLIEYTLSIRPLFILLFSSFFMLFSPTTIGILTALSKQGKIIYFYIAAILISAFLDMIVLVLGYGLIGVASVTFIVSLFLGTLLFLYAASPFFKGWRDYVSICVKSYLPYVYVFSVTVVLNFLPRVNHTSLLSDLAFLCLKIFILILLASPFILHLNNKIGLLGEVIEMLRYNLRVLRHYKPDVEAPLIKGE